MAVELALGAGTSPAGVGCAAWPPWIPVAVAAAATGYVVLLGLAAIALYPPQVYLIPRLQRKINALSKERVQTARALSDRTIAGLLAEPPDRYRDSAIHRR